MQRIRVGLLQTGVPPAHLRPGFGTYATMIEALLGPDFSYRLYDVMAGDLPETPEACDAYVITGSPAGVYDDLPWIPPLVRFLQSAKGRAKLIGICFGHQIMAEAFGGRVVKSDKGWGLGLHDYAVTVSAPWMDDPAPIAVAVSHQDQVVAPPPGARSIGGNAFTPNGILAYDDQPAMSFQCHPEFEPAFAAALVELRRAALPEATADAMVASLDRPNDRARVGTWMRRFIAQA